ncbi:MAG: hypothetical protein JWP37_1757 [Mucilaginibacter sp.]|nr:hypothetical protein [Mucilaginibacter sp.]
MGAGLAFPFFQVLFQTDEVISPARVRQCVGIVRLSIPILAEMQQCTISAWSKPKVMTVRFCSGWKDSSTDQLTCIGSCRLMILIFLSIPLS